MSVFYLTAGLRYVCHALCAEFVEFRVWSRLVISFLVCSRKHSCVGSNHIVFKFSHCLELHACYLVECLAGLSERVFRRTLQQFSVLVEIRAEHCYGRNFCKRIQECRAETRQYIKVAAACLNEREEARAIDALTASEDGVQVCFIVDYKVQRLESSVSRRIHEVDHSDAVLPDVFDDVRLCEFLARLAKCRHQLVRI